jgi:glucose/arabinose dehydrogenase
MSPRTKPLLLVALLAGLAYLLLHPPFKAVASAEAAPRTIRAVDDVREFPSQHGTVRVETVARGFEHPWALAFLPDGRLLVTERPGRLRLVSAAGVAGAPLRGLPAVHVEGQGGLLDVVVAPDFATSREVYFCYAEPRGSANGTALARARLDAAGSALEGVQVLFRQQPAVRSNHHFGCRIVFASDGTLWLTMGDRGSQRDEAQNVENHIGKVVRLARDGRVPADNPYRGVKGAAPELWSIGHRNAQGAARHPVTGALWLTEHGPQGGDEVNAPKPGRNYGWPVITHGREYSGLEVGDGISAKPGLEPPLWHWTPSIAPSGLAFYTAGRFAPWQGSLFAGSLKFGLVVRLTLDGEKVVAEERLLEGLNQRVRDVRQGPDGALYLLTDEGDGAILRVTLLGA